MIGQINLYGWKFEKDGIWIAGYQLGKRYTKSAISSDKRYCKQCGRCGSSAAKTDR
jgi:hypothetical protein